MPAMAQKGPERGAHGDSGGQAREGEAGLESAPMLLLGPQALTQNSRDGIRTELGPILGLGCFELKQPDPDIGTIPVPLGVRPAPSPKFGMGGGKAFLP